MCCRRSIICFLSQEISQTKIEIGKLKSELAEHEQFLEHQLANNRETQLESDNLNAEIFKLQQQMAKLNENYSLKTNDLISLKRLLANQSNQLQKTRQRNRQMIIEKEKLNKLIAKMKITVDELEKKLEMLNAKGTKAQNRLDNLTELAESEQKAIHNVELEIGRLSQMLYRSRQILQQFDEDNKTVQVIIISFQMNLEIKFCSSCRRTSKPLNPP